MSNQKELNEKLVEYEHLFETETNKEKLIEVVYIYIYIRS